MELIVRSPEGNGPGVGLQGRKNFTERRKYIPLGDTGCSWRKPPLSPLTVIAISETERASNIAKDFDLSKDLEKGWNLLGTGLSI